MTHIRWIGAALLGALGVAALLLTADAATIPVMGSGTTGDVAAGPRAQLASAVGRCWPYGLGVLSSVCLERGTGYDAATVYISVSGQRTLTRAQARAELLAGHAVRAGRLAEPESYRCVLSGAELAAAATFAGAYWSGPLSTLTHLCATRGAGGWAVTETTGVTTKDADQAVTDAENGADVSPVGVVAP